MRIHFQEAVYVEDVPSAESAAKRPMVRDADVLGALMLVELDLERVGRRVPRVIEGTDRDRLEVDRERPPATGDGELVDLNAASWLQAVDPSTSAVDATVFADLIAVVVR